jgi:hypothetical protein
MRWNRKKNGTTFIDLQKSSDFCIVVNLKNGVSKVSYFVVPTNLVQAEIDSSRAAWLKGKKRDGSERKDSTQQVLCLSKGKNAWQNYDEKWEQYLNAWYLLGSPNAK